MKRLILLTSISLAVPMMAFAQTNTPANPFAGRAGISYLTDRDSRRGTSDIGWTIGGGYDFHKGMSNERYSFDVDFLQHSGKGNRIDSWMFQLAVRAPFKKEDDMASMDKVKYYYGAGIGLFRHHISGSTTGNGGGNGGGGGGGETAFPSQVAPASTSFSETKNVFGGSLMVGARFSQNASLELAYHISGKVEGVNCNALTLTLGFKF